MGSPGLVSTAKNDYVKKPKDPTIETPRFLSQYIYELVKDKINFNEDDIILDLCCKNGKLSLPFKENNYNIVGIDKKDYSETFHSKFIHSDFLSIFKLEELNIKKPKLIVANVPWNNPDKILHKAYLPEVFLKQIFRIFGEDIPLVFLTSYTLLMNMSILKSGNVSERYKFLNLIQHHISGVLEQPLNSFSGVKLWNHSIFFNIDGLNPVMFIPEDFIMKYYFCE